MIMGLTARDTQLLCFFQENMRISGTTPTFGQIRLHLRLKTKQHAKQAFTDLVEHLTHIQIHPFQIAHSKEAIR